MTTECKIPGCTKSVFKKAPKKGLCRTHYERERLYGSPYLKAPKDTCDCGGEVYKKGMCCICYERSRVCSIDGCDKLVKGKGYCEMHLRRYRLYGDPLGKAPEREKAVCSHCGKPAYAYGLCEACHRQKKLYGTVEGVKVENIASNEEWRVASQPGYMVSNYGRMKSVLNRNEKLLKPTRSMHKNGKGFTLICNNRRSLTPFTVSTEVLLAFRGEPETENSKVQAVFLDGDRSNAHADNLRWDDRNYRVEKAIAMAEVSDHPLADCFLKFWQGNHNALNDWFEQQCYHLAGYFSRRVDRHNHPYIIDIDSAIQETLLEAFLLLHRGMLKNFDILKGWIYWVAQGVFRKFVDSSLPLIPLDKIWGDGSEASVADFTGWCHPSAEMQSIYNEECLS